MKPPWDGGNLVVTRLMGVLKVSVPLFIDVTGKKARRGDHPHAPRCCRRHRGAQPHRRARRDVSAPGVQPQHDRRGSRSKRHLGPNNNLSLAKRRRRLPNTQGSRRFLQSIGAKGLARGRRQPCSHRRWHRGCCHTSGHRLARGQQHRQRQGRRPAWYWDDSPWQAPAYRHR